RGVVTAEDFTAVAEPGSLTVSGTLNGEDESIDLRVTGGARTSSLDLPVDLSFLLEGSLSGYLYDPRAEFRLFEGSAFLEGNTVSFSADTLMADLNQVSVRDLVLTSADASVRADGELDLETLAWNTSLFMNMSGMNLARYIPSEVQTDISGTLSASLGGTGAEGVGGAADISLTASSYGASRISGLDLNGSLHEDRFTLSGAVSAEEGTVEFSGNGGLGPGGVPQSWELSVEGQVYDLSPLGQLMPPGMPEVSSVRISLSGSGSRFGMNMSGRVGVRELEMDGLSAGRLTLNGDMSYSTGSSAGSGPADLSFRGTVDAIDLATEGVSADTTSMDGSFTMAGRSRSLEASFVVDSLRIGSEALHLQAEVQMDGNEITVDGLTLAGSGERLYSADLLVSLGDTTFAGVRNIRATHSKLRLITEGEFSAFSTNGTFVLDTLRLDPPVGSLAASGMLDGEGVRLRADVENFDLTSFSTFSGLPEEMSGVGDFSLSYSRDTAGMEGSLTGSITAPAYGQFSMDSITVDVSADDDSLRVNGIYAWRNQVRSGLQMRAGNLWDGSEPAVLAQRIRWAEVEVNNLSDWLFYVLPLPVRTMGASVSARLEYRRYNGDYLLEMQASARISRLYITVLGIELPNVNFYLNYPDTTAAGYDTRFTLGSGSPETGNFSSTWRGDIISLFPLQLGEYSIRADLSEMQIVIPGIGGVISSGNLSMEEDGLDSRPLLSGKLRILEGAVGVPQPVAASSSNGSGDMPFDLSIDVSGTSDIWFRTSFADIEMALKLRIFTLERKPTVNGTVSAVRGRITLLQRDFQIIRGTVNIIQGHPPTMQLNVEGQTVVRSAMSRREYVITVLIQGDAENPEITLTGFGPEGQIAQEDILTLLAAGLTYGEMQQMNSSAIRSEVETVAQTMLGSLLARNIRHEIGLDTFEISPELLSDSTSLVLNVGKYVLPDLYVSYKDDVFSGDAGTVSAQYLFNSDLYIEGSSRTTIHGNLEPTIELHYTIRY
ncbi:MAG: translocation/assembly module TamB domain-containing protein, partial [Candidatus Aegiribacteria sp.]